jgi:hypothetical protein
MLRRTAYVLLLALPAAAAAHVKWFEDYAVESEPVPIATTLSLPYFWLGLTLVLFFFVAASIAERRSIGQLVMAGLDKGLSPIRREADRFLIAILAGFFVALFAVGGTYLTPELKTDEKWVHWAQLVIGATAVPRRTRPLAAIGIVSLWIATLRDYDLFHLFDYLALGVGLAGFLLMSSFPGSRFHHSRFAYLRWGIALALMWSSMEKFMYPQWFTPLLEERPFLSFGIAFGPYTTMAGVAEFTLGFGLLWTPLIRRLSAAALFLLMFSATFPFGRVDLIGHAPILATLIIILADPLHDTDLEVAPEGRRATWFVPVGLAVALAVTMTSYAGLHHLIYDRAQGRLAELARAQTAGPPEPRSGPPPGGFWRGQGHWHGGSGAERLPGADPTAAMMTAMNAMHEEMNALGISGDPDRDFAALMIPHHRSAVSMAEIYLRHGRDPELRRIAGTIISGQTAEVGELQRFIGPDTMVAPSSSASPRHDH